MAMPPPTYQICFPRCDPELVPGVTRPRLKMYSYGRSAGKRECSCERPTGPQNGRSLQRYLIALGSAPRVGGRATAPARGGQGGRTGLVGRGARPARTVRLPIESLPTSRPVKPVA